MIPAQYQPLNYVGLVMWHEFRENPKHTENSAAGNRFEGSCSWMPLVRNAQTTKQADKRDATHKFLEAANSDSS